MAEEILALMVQAMKVAPSSYSGAMLLLLEAQTRARQAGDTCLLVRAIAAEARVALRQRQVEAVLARHAESLRIAAACGQPEARFYALYGLARTWADLLLSERALQCLTQAVPLVGAPFAEAQRGWLTFHASVLSQCGRVDEADRLYTRMLQLPGLVEDRLVHGTTLLNLAVHHARNARVAEGLAAADAAEQVLNEAGTMDTATRTELATCRTRLLLQADRAAEALALLQPCFASPPPASPWACGLWLASAEVHLALGALASAEEAHQRAMDMALRMSIPRMQDILLQAARIAERTGNQAWAAQMAMRAREEAARFEQLAVAL